MRYGDVSQRELGSVFLQCDLVTYGDGSVDTKGEASFVFKSHDGNIEEGPTITCVLSTPVEDLQADQVQPFLVQKALKMVRRLAEMSDDEVLATWRDSVSRASEGL